MRSLLRVVVGRYWKLVYRKVLNRAAVSVQLETRECKIRDVFALRNVTESPGMLHRPARVFRAPKRRKGAWPSVQKFYGLCPHETLMLQSRFEASRFAVKQKYGSDEHKTHWPDSSCQGCSGSREA